MSATLLRLPKLPEFDRAADGNPFAWIVKTAPKVRAERQAIIEQAQSKARAERRHALRPIAP